MVGSFQSLSLGERKERAENKFAIIQVRSVF